MGRGLVTGHGEIRAGVELLDLRRHVALKRGENSDDPEAPGLREDLLLQPPLRLHP